MMENCGDDWLREERKWVNCRHFAHCDVRQIEIKVLFGMWSEEVKLNKYDQKFN